MDAGQIVTLLEFSQYRLSEVLSYIILYFGIFWFSICFWVYRDISKRTNNLFSIVLAVVGVLVFNILGLILYLLIRPEHTLSEHQALDIYQLTHLDQQLLSCPTCQHIVPRSFKYCTSCGSGLEMKCHNCNEQIDPMWQHCPHCAVQLYLSSEDNINRKRSIVRLNLLLAGLSIYRGSADLLTRLTNPFIRLVGNSSNLIAILMQRLASKVHMISFKIKDRFKAIKLGIPKINIVNTTAGNTVISMNMENANVEITDAIESTAETPIASNIEHKKKKKKKRRR